MASESEFFNMFGDLFSDTDECKRENVLKCKSVHRIKILLKQFNDIVDEESSEPISRLQNQAHDLIHHKLGQDVYNNAMLLNDFHHIKYEHNVEKDVEKFDQVFDSLPHRCNIKTCKYLMYHYRDRTQVDKSYANSPNDNDNIKEYGLNLICRVHTYLFHSYDLNKLTKAEINTMNDTLNQFKQTLDIDDENYSILLQEKKLDIVYTTIKEKAGKALDKVQSSKSKFIEPVDDKYQLFQDVLFVDNELNPLLYFFWQHEYDTDAIYDDLEQKDESNIYTYFTQNLKNKINQYGVLCEVVEIYAPFVLSCNLLTHQQQIKTYILTQFCGFTSATVDVAKKFLIATNWDMTLAVDRYFRFDGDVSKIQMPHKAGTDHRRDSTKLEPLDLSGLNSNKSANDIYSLGTKFWYWQSMKNQPNYIQPKHGSLKFDVFYHNEIDCNVSSWQALEEECNVLLNSATCKRIVSSGNNKQLYGIEANNAFYLEHICALLLYTNYTVWCSLFCQIIRDGNKKKICAIANWARLLIEVVQCYGSFTSSMSMDIPFYRGINREFTFKKFVASFNVPLSTTTEIVKAAEFAGFADSGDGLVVQLRDYDAINNVCTFSCDGLSAFPQEKEMLFYGGDTILKIHSIWQISTRGWNNYEHYVAATDFITRMMNGLTVNTANIATKVRKCMRVIFKSQLNAKSENKMNLPSDLPKYIVNRLINYHIGDRTTEVEFHYDELVTKYKFIKTVFMNTKHEFLNIYNICCIFNKCSNIIINMPDVQGATPTNTYAQSTTNILDDSTVADEEARTKNQKTNKALCVALKNDLAQLIKDNVQINKLQLNWSSVPLETKFQIINLFAKNYAWKTECSPTSIQLIPQDPEVAKEMEQKLEKDTIKLPLTGGLDYDENQVTIGSDSEEEDDEFMQFNWNVDSQLLKELNANNEIQSEAMEIEGFGGYKWTWKLQKASDEMQLSLQLSELPMDMGAFKFNCILVCDELSYHEEHNEAVLAVGGHEVSKNKEKSLKVNFPSSAFEDNQKIAFLFECSIEILVRYDYFGGVFSEVDKPIYVQKSENRNKIVYGFINQILNFNQRKILQSPLQIYELIYKYYLMFINIQDVNGEFVWKFNDESEIKLFLTCNKDDVITSRKFELFGSIFYFELTPNGWGENPKG
eukprot:51450_1